MKFAEVLERLRDGMRYKFSHPGLSGFFHKAPYPSQDIDVAIDGAYSAITYWSRNGQTPCTPVHLLDDFERDDWWIHVCPQRPTSTKPLVTPPCGWADTARSDGR